MKSLWGNTNTRSRRIRIRAALFLFAPGFTAGAAGLEIDVSDSVGRPLPDAVAYLVPTSGSLPSAAGATAVIDQVNRTFVPFTSVIRTGTAVKFPNSDDIRHSVYSFSPAKTFTLKLYSGVPADPVIFDKPGLVVLGCNIHDSMLAYVKVVDTPYFAKSGPDGKIKLDRMPNGSYQLQVWHPWLSGAEPTQAVTLTAATASPLHFALPLQAPPSSHMH